MIKTFDIKITLCDTDRQGNKMDRVQTDFIVYENGQPMNDNVRVALEVSVDEDVISFTTDRIEFKNVLVNGKSHHYESGDLVTYSIDGMYLKEIARVSPKSN